MTALDKDRKTDQFGTPDIVIPQLLQFPVAAATTIYGGGLVATDAAGNAVPATGASSSAKVWGRCEKQVINTVAAGYGTAGDLDVDVRLGVFYFNDGSSGDAITAANVGMPCYVIDDNTVGLTPGTTVPRPLAGTIYNVRADGQIGVLVGFNASTFSPPLQTGVTPAHVANDIIITAAQAISGTKFLIGALDAASTLTLPADAADGTILYFVADGTLNDQTLQYRDATGPVNLTTALVASKRHLVVAIKQGAFWVANAYVAP